MSRLPILVSWIASSFLLLLSLGSLISNEWLSGLLSLGIALLFLPPLTNRLSGYLHRFARYGIAAVLAVILLIDTQSSAQPLNRTQDDGTVSSASSISNEAQIDPTSPTDALNGIRGISVEVFDEQGRMGSKAQPPIEIIVQASVSDCFDAKVKLFDVMKKVYTDQSLRPSLGRVVFNAPPFVRAALDAKDGYDLSADSWNASGPSNLYSVLQSVHEGDGGELWRTWVQTLNGCL